MTSYFAISPAIQLTTVHCGKCGGHYAIDEHVRKQHEEDGTYWNCPYCKTGWGYGESDADRLRKQLKVEQNKAKQREWELQEARNEMERTRAEAAEKLKKSQAKYRAQKGQNTRLKKRVGHGVCPCCHRTFKQLQRHMKSQHPEFLEKQ